VRGTERRPLRQGIAAPSLEKEVAVERAAEEEEEEQKGYKDQQSQTGERSGVIRPVQQREGDAYGYNMGDGTASSSAFLGRTRDRHEDDVESPPF